MKQLVLQNKFLNQKKVQSKILVVLGADFDCSRVQVQVYFFNAL